MKTKKVIYLFLVVTMILPSFLILKPITVVSVRESLLRALFNQYDKTDSTVFFNEFDKYEGKDIKVFAASQCESDPSFITYSLFSAVDTGYVGYSPEVLARYKALFGQDLIKGKFKMAQKDYDGNPLTFNQYNAIALKAAFDKLYQNPTGTYKGIGLQKIYNLTMKNYVRDVTGVIVDIMAKKTIWDAEAKRFLQQATTNPEFDGGSFAYETYVKILGENYPKECLGHPGNMISTMLRRQCDGSLPTLLLCLKTVLKDYDPEFYNKVALKF